MATVYYTASSLDGFVADDSQTLSWLLSCEVDPDGPMGFRRFVASVGAMVMGARTFRWVLDHDRDAQGRPVWPHQVPCWVFTHRPLPPVSGDVRRAQGSLPEVHAEVVAAAEGRDVWVVGGGDLAAQLAEHGLLDEMWVQYAPVTLGSGTPLLPRPLELRLIDVARNGDLACLRHQVVRDG